jgi:hypothetical protein
MASSAEEGGTGRRFQSLGQKLSNDNAVNSSRLLLLQRRLKRAKQPNRTTNTYMHHPNTAHVQRKKLDGFLQKTQKGLTISTTETTCSSSEGLSHANHSFDYPISRFQSHQILGSESYSSDSYGSSSMEEESFATSFTTSFDTTSQAPDAAVLFKEWRNLYALSEVTSVNYADDEATKQEEFRLIESTSRHSDVEVVIDGSPSDLLSAQCTVEGSSSDTTSTVNRHIPTPPEATSAACAFSFNFFGNEMLKSVAKKVSQMNASGVNDDDSDYSDNNSALSANSGSTEETDLIKGKLVKYDEGETPAQMNWTFDSSEAGTITETGTVDF